MYTEVWNDQPPLHTFLVAEIVKHRDMANTTDRNDPSYG
jgi:hypothetical protein